MRSRTPLILMEQMIMLLVFALAAALCLQAFVKSDQLSKDSENRDQAAVLCQSAAEAVRSCQGDMAKAAAILEVPYPYSGEGSPLEIHYTEDWKLCDTREYAFCLKAEAMDSGTAGLGKALVAVFAVPTQEVPETSPLFSIEVAWQEEVSAHG